MWCHVLICALLPLSGQKNGPFDAVYRAGEPQTVRVRTVITVRENTRANAALRVVAPSGETIRYERIDFMHALNGAEPWRDRSLVRAAGEVTNEFILVLESAGDYALKLSRAAASWKSWKTPLDPVGVWVEKVGPLAVPEGFVPARVHPMTVALNTGVADARKRFRSTFHQNYPVFFNSQLLVDAGCDVEQNDYGRTDANPTGLKGAHNLQSRPDWGALNKAYPMPKEGETFAPVGRKANSEGKYWNEWSVSFEPANESAYKKDVEEVQKVVSGPLNDRVESWNIAWEQAGTYDYGETSVKAYRTWLEKRYGSLAKLNATWHTDYKTFSEIVPARLYRTGSAFAGMCRKIRQHPSAVHPHSRRPERDSRYREFLFHR